MAEYLIVKARNILTGQTQKQQDLTGTRLELSQQSLADELAERLAADLTSRTREPWVPLVERYTPSVRRGS